LPDFHVESIILRPTGNGGYVVTVTVANSGGAGGEIPVSAVVREGKMTHKLLVPAKGKAVVRIETPSAPEEVVVNDGGVPESDTSNNTYKISASEVPGS
jgi:hypothetical protein